MKNWKKGFVFSSLALALIMGGCGSAENSTNAAGNTQGSAGSTVTGKLSFYTSQPEDDVAKLTAGFNGQYPDVQVEVFRSGTEEVVTKLQAEKTAGAVQADVLLLADSVTFEGLKQQDLLLSYKSPELSEIPADLVDPDGMYSGTKVIATILAHNTSKVSAAPTSWHVLTDAASKGQSIMPSPLYSGAAAYNVGVFTRTDGFGWDFFQGLKDNAMTVIKGNGAVLKAVASGEQSYGVVVDYMVAREKAKGSPIELNYPQEGVPIITEPIAIMNNTKNEAAAKAFVDYVLSEDGQKLAAEIGYTPIRKGVAAPEGLKAIGDMTILSGDIKTLTAEREADKQQFTKLFGQ